MAVSKYSYENINKLFKDNTEKYIIEVYKNYVDNLYNEDYLKEVRTFSNNLQLILTKHNDVYPKAFTTELVQKVLYENFNVPSENVSVEIKELNKIDHYEKKFVYNCYINIKLDIYDSSNKS
jgi:hypothetical protein